MILDDENILENNLLENNKYADLYELRNLYKSNKLTSKYLNNVIQKIVNDNLIITDINLHEILKKEKRKVEKHTLSEKFSYINVQNNIIVIHFYIGSLDWYFYIYYNEIDDEILFTYNTTLSPVYTYMDNVDTSKYNNLMSCYNYINKYYNLDRRSDRAGVCYSFKF